MIRLPHSTILPSRVRSWMWALGLILSLIFSQSLGQLHAIKHGGHAPHQAHEIHQAHQTHQGHEHLCSSGFLEHLFSSHGSDSDCRLYDQLSDGYAMPAVVLVALPALLPPLLVVTFQGEALARWAALFDARGPPLTF